MHYIHEMKTRGINTINIVTLGCSKNIVDSEVLMRQLHAGSINVLHNAGIYDAKTVIINTCGFIKDAKQESIDTILQFVKAKEEGSIENLFVMGCLSERYRKDLEIEIPEVNKYFGVNDLKQIIEIVGTKYRKELTGERMLTTPGHYAYLKISEGCDRSCAFCAIPLIRGKHKSRSMEELIGEAQFLGRQGVKELILIAQDLTYYGVDIYKKQSLSDLLNRLADLPYFEWIRLHYAYPAGFPKEIIQVIKNRENICKYLDIPFQHISNPVLKKMRRNHDKTQAIELVDYFRNEIPDISLRTTLLVGHPGEGEKEFLELAEFVEQVKFSRLGVFTYSEEESTYAALRYKDTIPERIKQNRLERIMEIQQKISAKYNHHKEGVICKVIIDRIEGDFYIGRTEADSPEVDNEVLIKKSAKKLIPGKFYQIKISSSNEYDLFGEVNPG